MQIVPTLSFGGNCREVDPAFHPLMKEDQKDYIYHGIFLLYVYFATRNPKKPVTNSAYTIFTLRLLYPLLLLSDYNYLYTIKAKSYS